MKLLVAIPSKKRLDVLMANALAWIPQCDLDWRVFVEPQDFEVYKESVAEERLVNIGANDQGLGFSKGVIKKYAQENGYTHIFKIDDDVKGFTRFRTVMRPVTKQREWIQEVLAKIEKSLIEYPQVKCVAFPYSFEMYDRKGWEVTKRVQTAYIIETEWLYENPKVSVFEDFATGLSVLVQGGLIAKFCLAGIQMGVKVGGGTGGHQSYDRAEKAVMEGYELRNLYPPLNFRKVDKAWKIEPDMSSVNLPIKK